MKLIKPIITVEIFDQIPNDEIFATGITTDGPEGLNMIRSGRELTWIAKKGIANDWCVYTHFSSNSIAMISMEGDKVRDRNNIDNILEINDELWERYRK